MHQIDLLSTEAMHDVCSAEYACAIYKRSGSTKFVPLMQSMHNVR